jgi:UDP-glucose 4-epimerase
MHVQLCRHRKERALRDPQIASGNVKLAMSHVVLDLVQKVLKGHDPIHIGGSGTQVRHYTYGGDSARGIRLCVEHPAALNQDFNLSTPCVLIEQEIHNFEQT